MRIHLVYDSEYEGLKDALEVDGYEIVERDYTLEQFKDFSMNGNTNTDVALINGYNGSLDKQGIYDTLKQTRVNLPRLRLIVQFPESFSEDRKWVLDIIGLGIYDIHFIDEFDLHDVENWLHNEMTIASHSGNTSEENTMNQSPIQRPIKKQEKKDLNDKKSYVESDLTIEQQPIITQSQTIEHLSVDNDINPVVTKETRWKDFFNIFKIKKIKLKSRSKVHSKIKKSNKDVNNKPEKEQLVQRSLDVIFELTPVPNPNIKITGSQTVSEEIPQNTQDIKKNKREPQNAGKVIGFFSGTKGSVGKTTISSNTAAFLQYQGFKVALVDADEHSRGATMMSFQDDVSLPKKSAILGGVTIYSLSSIQLEDIQSKYDFIIIDFGNLISFSTMSVLRQCNTLFLIAIPESLSVSIIRRFLDKEGKELINRIHLIINRYEAGRGTLEPWDVAKRMGIECSFIIPDDIQNIELASSKKTAAIFVKKNQLKEPIDKGFKKLNII
ncbi:AAA family ATPase [Chengkuizengella sediminis]|uniref:AAA family ATPase n=1 Tax=Chengkuizengella sediminis TaxID=1885917 RepID=UPI001389965B|nr:AAA family ATPase [Chengkuizengella sediminis]NDI36646.1 AAA family ATPase [Chengkuizengella sediminis]